MKKFRYFILALVCCVGFLSVGSMRVYAFESEDNFYPVNVDSAAINIFNTSGGLIYTGSANLTSDGNKYSYGNPVVSGVDNIQWIVSSSSDPFTFPYNDSVYNYYLLGTLAAYCDNDSNSTWKPTKVYAMGYDVDTASYFGYRRSEENIYNIDNGDILGFGFSQKIEFDIKNNIGISGIWMGDDKDGTGNKPANLIAEFGVLAVPIGTDEAVISQQILNKLSEMESSLKDSIDANTSAIQSLSDRITSTLSDFFGPYFDNITDAFKKALPDTQDSQNEVLSGAMDDYQAAEQVVFSPAMDSLTEFDFESHNISSLGTGFVAAITFVSSCMTNMYDLTPFSFVFGVIATLGLASICIGLSRLWFGKKGK